jgi:sugar phosphate isomerase/epimerase
VSAVSSWRWSFEEDLAFWREARVDRVELSLRKCAALAPEQVARRLADEGIDVVSVGETGHFALDEPTTWASQRERLLRAVELANAVDASTVVLLPGAPGSLGWEAALESLAGALGLVTAAAADAGVGLALENTSPLRVDLSFVHTLRDCLDAARSLQVRVCMEIQSCWAERALDETIRHAADLLALVQVSDAMIGSATTPDRVVPGDGDVPLHRILDEILRAGYRGSFDLELVGPRIEAEGYAAAIRRSIERLDRLLEELACLAPG